MTIILEALDLNRSFGAVSAAKDITVRMKRGETVGIIGANGAGKTTFVNMVTGYTKPTSGRILFEGHDITGATPKDVTRAGIVRSFQVPQLFGTMTVSENLLIALGTDATGAEPFWQRLATAERLETCRDMLARFGIAGAADSVVATLPQGVRKLLDIAMALAQRPRLVLLDEPTSGVSAEEKIPLMDTVFEAVHDSGATILFVEHDMELVERYAERVLAFYAGTVIADGRPGEALREEKVLRHVIGTGWKRG